MSRFVSGVLSSSFGVLISRLFGLVRDIVVAAVFGASALTDAFFVAFAIPNLFRQFFAEGAMTSAFVPILSDKMKNNGYSVSNRYLSHLIYIQVAVILAITLLFIALAPYVVLMFMPGLADQHDLLNLAATLLRVLMPYLLLVSVCGLLSGFLNLNGNYFVPYSSTAFMNLFMIVGAGAGYWLGKDIYWLAVGTTLGGVAQLFYVWVFARRKGMRFTSARPVDPDVKRTFKLIVPSIAGVGVTQLNFLVDRVVASYLASGSISFLFYANRLFQFPFGLFSVAVGTVSLTELSKAKSADNQELYEGLIDKALLAILLIMLPAMLGMMQLAEGITGLIYGRKAFTANDVAMTASALQMYTAGLLFYSMVNLFTRVFHVHKNTSTPVKVAFVGFFANLILNIAFMRFMGHAGIALASSIAAAVNSIMLYRLLPDYRFNLKKHLPFVSKVLLAGFAMSVAIEVCKAFGVHVLIAIPVCGAAYFAVLLGMRIRLREAFR